MVSSYSIETVSQDTNIPQGPSVTVMEWDKHQTTPAGILLECLPRLKQCLNHRSDPMSTAVPSATTALALPRPSPCSIKSGYSNTVHLSLVVTGSKANCWTVVLFLVGSGRWTAMAAIIEISMFAIICRIKWLATMWVSKDVQSSCLCSFRYVNA